MVMFACELERQRKLDLSAPLMSIRRHQQQQPDTPTTTTATSDEEEEQNEVDEAWESMRSPGAVPFVWERTPGRPKAVDSRRSRHHQQAPPPPPPPPPGRLASPLHDSWRSGGGSSLFKRRLPSFLVKAPAAPSPAMATAVATGSSAPQLKDRQGDEEDDAFSDAKQTENWTATTELEDEGPGGGDSPAARDFIMRRFLPAAKAMADESSATPFRSFLDKKNGEEPASTTSTVTGAANKQVAATMPPRSPSVERIQAWQYKFSSSSRRRRRQRGDSDSGDFFAMRACGFFSMGLLRRRLPASRLRRSDLNGEVKQPSVSSSSSPSPSEARKPATAPEAFYDTETSFAARIFSPQTVAASAYRTPGTSSVVDDSRGFLGLPEDYKPPEDPYKNAGRSPVVQDKNGAYRSWRSEQETGDGSRHVFVSVPSKEPSSLLRPPKSPSHPWLWTTVPQPPPPPPSTKWEAAVKSRQLRPGHLRYSEEDALQPCQY